MGYVYGYSSSKEIINNVYRDLNLSENISYDSAVNWIYRVLEFIGAPTQYIPRVLGWKEDERLDFSAYTFPLPPDFHALRFLSINGFPTRPSSDSTLYLKDGDCCSDLSALTGNSLIQFQDNFGNEFSTAFGSKINSTEQGYTFNINSGIVTTNTKTGKACLFYDSIPIDNLGFPLIPDNEKVKNAVELYIRTKLLYIRWIEDSDSRGKREVYLDSEKEYCFAIGQATNDLKMPEIGEMENIKNSLIRLKPRIQEYNNFFKSLSNNNGIRR